MDHSAWRKSIIAVAWCFLSAPHLMAQRTTEQLVEVQGSGTSHLEFRGGDYKDKDLPKLLAKEPQATEITFVGCVNLTNESLKHLSQLPRITAISVISCSDMNSDGLTHLMDLPDLNSLRLTDAKGGIQGGSFLTPKAKVAIAGFKKLRSLEISGCECKPQTTVAILDELALANRLEHLTISDAAWPNDIVPAIARIKSLRSLTIFHLEGSATKPTEQTRLDVYSDLTTPCPETLANGTLSETRREFFVFQCNP